MISEILTEICLFPFSDTILKNNLPRDMPGYRDPYGCGKDNGAIDLPYIFRNIIRYVNQIAR
jgi:hypothetical protein